jgi:hypothetical protein
MANPLPKNTIEDLETKIKQTQGEASEKQTKTAETFKQTKTAIALLEALGDLKSIENPDAVFERIVTLYSKNGENIKTSIGDVFSPPQSTQLWIPEISEDKRIELITSIMSFIDENFISTTTISQEWRETEENAEWKWDEELKKTENHTEEHPFYPTLLRLKNEGNIEVSELDSIVKDVEKNGASNEAFLNSIKSVIKDSWKQEKLLSLLKDIPPQEAKENFFKDAKVPEKEQGDNISILIGENYKKIPNEKWKSNTQEDIKLAVQTATNKIIHGKKDIKRDDPTFQDAMKVILNGNDVKSMYQALKTIHSFVNTGEGKKEKKEKTVWENESWKNPGRQAMMEKINTIIADAKIAWDNKKMVAAKEVWKKLAEEQVTAGEGWMGWGEELDTLLANLDTFSPTNKV